MADALNASSCIRACGHLTLDLCTVSLAVRSRTANMHQRTMEGPETPVSAQLYVLSSVDRLNALHMHHTLEQGQACQCFARSRSVEGNGSEGWIDPKQPHAGACRRVLISHISSRCYVMCIVLAPRYIRLLLLNLCYHHSIG